MPDFLDIIQAQIQERMRALRPAVEEYELQETMLAVLTGEAEVVATTKQRQRTKRKRAVHNGNTHKARVPTRYLNDEQVAQIKVEARSKRIGLNRLMTRYGYVQDERGWRSS